MGMYDRILFGWEEEEVTSMGKLACLQDAAEMIDLGMGITELADVLHAQISDIDELDKQASELSFEDAAGYRAGAYELLAAIEDEIAAYADIINEDTANEAAYDAFEKVAAKKKTPAAPAAPATPATPATTKNKRTPSMWQDMKGSYREAKKDVKDLRKEFRDNLLAGRARSYTDLGNSLSSDKDSVIKALKSMGRTGIQGVGRAWSGGANASAMRRLAPKAALGAAGAAALIGAGRYAKRRYDERQEREGNRKRASFEPDQDQIELAYEILEQAGHIDG